MYREISKQNRKKEKKFVDERRRKNYFLSLPDYVKFAAFYYAIEAFNKCECDTQMDFDWLSVLSCIIHQIDMKVMGSQPARRSS